MSVNLVEEDGIICSATLAYELLLPDQNKLEINATPYRVARLTLFHVDNYRQFQEPYLYQVKVIW